MAAPLAMVAVIPISLFFLLAKSNTWICAEPDSHTHLHPTQAAKDVSGY